MMTHSTALLYNADCSLLGITPDFHIYVEELVEDWTIQHIIAPDGQLLKTVDERRDDALLTLSPDLIKPLPVRATIDLNFTGGRFRGLREPERVQDWMKPLTVQEKMTVAPRLNVQTMMILGIAESVVMAEAKIDERYLVCRRVRIAYALPETRHDADRQPYDYDTYTLYLAHFYQPDIDLIASLNAPVPDIKLCRPMDCIAHDGRLIIADGGQGDQKSRLHVFHI